MEKTIIDQMCTIVEKMYDAENNKDGITLGLIDRASDTIDTLKEILGLSSIQTVFLTSLVRKNATSSISGQSLSHTLGINYLKFLSYNKELEDMQKKGYIRINKNLEIALPRSVLHSLIENKPIKPEPTTGLNSNDLLIRIKRALYILENGQCSTAEMVDDLNYLMLANPTNSVSRVVLRVNKNLPVRETAVLYAMIFRYYFENDDMVGWHDMVEYFTDEDLAQLRFYYKTDRLHLQREGILKYAGVSGYMEKDHFKLDDEIKEDIFSDVGGIRKTEKRVSSSNKLEATAIIPKELFYNQSEKRQVEQLKELMSKKRFDDIRSKMKEKGFRTGFSCLFYGGPGTGKTETVYQIARESSRDLFVVDVSQIKSYWVGESEKNIKKVFDKYRETVKDGGIIPILLFNEADAVFGIRREGANGAVDKMENAIQNIILQEMEDLDGILIATTNLTTNLDSAFERRFLYKIRFEKPAKEARVSIWRAMLPSLTETEAEILANDFDFSGGQIENIVRKREVKSIIDDYEPRFDELIALCSEEIIGNNPIRKKIGY